jgi:hypothetical protein
VRILAMISAPSDLAGLSGEDEWDKLNDALSDLAAREMVQVDRLETGTLRALQPVLRRHDYHVLHFVGHGYYDQEAEDGALAELVPICERVLGPDAIDTVGDLGKLAYWSGQAGDAAGARDQYAKLSSVLESILGPSHWRTLNARSELAHWTGEAGDAAGARDQYAALLPVLERTLGPEHPDVLDARKSLASWTQRSKTVRRRR